MSVDYTRLIEGLVPKLDGESAVRHRTALVDAVNVDGTVDLDFDGTIIPNVSVLDGVAVGAGDVVQVIAWAGDLLVLGRSRTADTGAGTVLLAAPVTVLTIAAASSSVVAFTDIDVTASTHAEARAAIVNCYFNSSIISTSNRLKLRGNGVTTGGTLGDGTVITVYPTAAGIWNTVQGVVPLDSGQVFEYAIDRASGNWQAGIDVVGYIL